VLGVSRLAGISEESAAGSAGAPRPLKGLLPRIAVSLLIAGGFAWLLLKGGLPLLPSRDALARLPLWTVTAYLTMSCLAAFLRCYRWLHLVRPLDPGAQPARVLGISLVGFSAVFFAPLRSGEVARPYLLSQDRKVTFLQAAGTVGAERVIDGLIITIITFVAMSLATPISPLPRTLGDLPLPVSAVPAAVYGALLVFSAAFASMFAFYVARDTAQRLTERLVGLVSKRLAAWAAGTLGRIADGLSFLPSAKNLLPFLGQTLVMWGLVVAAQWVLLRGMGMPATVTQAATTVGVQGLGSVVPAGPGMFGAYQIAGFSALAMFFPLSQVKIEGAVFIFVAYTSTLVINAVQFVLGFLLMAKAPATPDAVTR
jgi:glycosyltransferase 2 family protein